MAKRNYDNWSKEELVKEIQKLEKRKKYGIVWEEEKEPEKVVTLCKEKLPVLIEDKRKEIETDKDKPVNILIEGDNYHALSVLNYTHKGRIDVIYIDPPYNTGNKDFVFNDKYIDLEDSYRHSKWISFMAKRLRLVKNLLKDTGVIFISIDDNEIAQLKLLCDEIFYENNFLSSVVWQKTFSPINLRKNISNNHDFILVYAKNINYLNLNLLERSEEQNNRYKNPDNDPRGPWTAGGLDVGPLVPEKVYPIYNPYTKSKILPPKGYCWRYTKERLEELIKENRIYFPKSGRGVPRIKRFLRDVQQGIVATTFWSSDEIGHTQEAKQELKTITVESDLVFETPKPLRLIKRILHLSTKKNSLVLDFMAGSGTTGHAVLELNKEDGGNRQFILCTNNENNICTDVCYPRIKKAIEGYRNLKKDKIEGLKGNLKYFTTDFVDAEPTDRNKKKLVDKSTEMLCLKEDCFDSTKKDLHFRIFKNNQNKYLGIIYDDDGIEFFKKEAKKMKKKFVVYVFSLDESAREEEFEDMVDMVQLKPIPAVILNVYKRIFK